MQAGESLFDSAQQRIGEEVAAIERRVLGRDSRLSGTVRLTVSGVVAVKEGIGLAALPCFVGDIEPGLVPVRPLLPDLGAELWLLTHEDLRTTVRVCTFADFMAKAVGQDRDLIEGRRPGEESSPNLALQSND